MLSRAYVHRAAGKIAASIFAAGGLAVGAAIAILGSGSPPLAINAVVWALASGMTAYFVFASDALQRPDPIWQGAVGDGVVAGITAGALLFALDVMLQGHAGSGSAGPSPGLVILSLLAGAGGGATFGSILGGAVLAVGGTDRLRRAPLRSRSVPRHRSRGRKKRRR